MPSYKLSKAAAGDFRSILTFGVTTFGQDQAATYANALKIRLEQIAQHPQQYQIIDHIKPNYRRYVFGSHAIYFRIEKEYVLIVRILGQQNLESAFI